MTFLNLSNATKLVSCHALQRAQIRHAAQQTNPYMSKCCRIVVVCLPVILISTSSPFIYVPHHYPSFYTHQPLCCPLPCIFADNINIRTSVKDSFKNYFIYLHRNLDQWSIRLVLRQINHINISFESFLKFILLILFCH